MSSPRNKSPLPLKVQIICNTDFLFCTHMRTAVMLIFVLFLCSIVTEPTYKRQWFKGANLCAATVFHGYASFLILIA